MVSLTLTTNKNESFQSKQTTLSITNTVCPSQNLIHVLSKVNVLTVIK